MESEMAKGIYMPEDVMMDILARLPVKSLLKFKCVCKSWCALIKSGNFVTKHLNYASMDDKAARVVVIDDNSYPDSPYITTVLSNDGVEIYHDFPNSFLRDNNHENCIGRIVLSGSCNGILGICDYYESTLTRMALWNPAIREFKHLILDDGDVGNHRTGYVEGMTVIGFGLNTETNVIKVVRYRKFVNGERNRTLDQYSIIDVYDVVAGNNNNSWRKLDEAIFPVSCNDSQSVYADGFCYWSASFDDANGTVVQCVLSFDFANEVFERILLHPEANCHNEPIVTTCGESIAIFEPHYDFDYPDLDVTVWMLHREGGKKTWNKQFVIKGSFMVNALFLRGGKLVILINDELILLDPSSQQYNKLMDFYETYAAIEIMSYTETLVSFQN